MASQRAQIKRKLAALLNWLGRVWFLTKPWQFVIAISLMALVFTMRYISSIGEVIGMDWYSALFRILTLVAFVGTFAYLFGLLRTEWEFTARPISIMVAGIVRDGLLKAFRLFSMVYLLSAGISLLLEPSAG